MKYVVFCLLFVDSHLLLFCVLFRALGVCIDFCVCLMAMYHHEVHFDADGWCAAASSWSIRECLCVCCTPRHLLPPPIVLSVCTLQLIDLLFHLLDDLYYMTIYMPFACFCPCSVFVVFCLRKPFLFASDVHY